MLYKLFSIKSIRSSRWGFGDVTKKGFPDDMIDCFFTQLAKPAQRNDITKVFRHVSPW